MYIHNIDPIVFDFGIIEIRWYSLAYIFGILFGWWLAKKILKKRSGEVGGALTQDIFDDYVTYLIISLIVGGRLGYVIFYDLSYYHDNLLDILKIWKGGMSFHGGLIGVIIGTYIFLRNKEIKILVLLDLIACVSPIGLFFGRLANFINAELYGKPTDVFWSVIFPAVDNIPRHPSQIYEALLEGIVLFLIMIVLILNKKIRSGMCSSLFLIFYGLFRIFSEQFREPDKQVGYIFEIFSMGSLLSLVMILFGIILFTKVINKPLLEKK